MENREAKRTLDDLERLRQRTRARASMSWLPFVVFGPLVVVSAPFTQVWDGAGQGVYWLVAGPAGLAITWRLFWEREERLGIVDRNAYAYAAIIAAMTLAAIAVGWAGWGGTVSEVGPLYPISGGLVAIAVLRRSALIGASGAAIAAWGTAVLIVDPAEPGIWAVAGEGVILLAAGVLLLAASSRRLGARRGLGATAAGPR